MYVPYKVMYVPYKVMYVWYEVMYVRYKVMYVRYKVMFREFYVIQDFVYQMAFGSAQSFSTTELLKQSYLHLSKF